MFLRAVAKQDAACQTHVRVRMNKLCHLLRVQFLANEDFCSNINW